MGEASKGAVTYSRPFWRDKELAGALYSRAGPFVQMYDQCGHTGKHAALVSWTLNCNPIIYGPLKLRHRLNFIMRALWREFMLFSPFILLSLKFI